MIKNIYIIGVGSAFGADQVGWLVIDALQQKAVSKAMSAAAIHLLKYDRPDFSVLSSIQSADYLFIIDAVVTGNKPTGSIMEFNLAEFTQVKKHVSTHGFNIAEILAMGGVLSSLPENIICYGVEILPDNKFARLSSQILQAVPYLVEKIAMEVNAIISKQA